MPIELEITHFFEQIEIPDDELESLLRVASWQASLSFLVQAGPLGMSSKNRSTWRMIRKKYSALQTEGGRCLESGKIPSLFRRPRNGL